MSRIEERDETIANNITEEQRRRKEAVVRVVTEREAAWVFLAIFDGRQGRRRVKEGGILAGMWMAGRPGDYHQDWPPPPPPPP